MDFSGNAPSPPLTYFIFVLHLVTSLPQQSFYLNSKSKSFLFVLFREGKLDVLKELCLEHKDGDYIHTALKSKDKFGQTPMLSSISASENRNEILKFLLNLILERSSDTALQEVRAILEMEF